LGCIAYGLLQMYIAEWSDEMHPIVNPLFFLTELMSTKLPDQCFPHS